MSESDLIAEMAAGVLGAPRHDASFDRELWLRAEELGLTLVGVDEHAGGDGATLAEAGVVAQTAARVAAPLPLAETALLGGWLLSVTGHDLPEGPLTATVAEGVELVRRDDRYELSAVAHRVPWARQASRIALLAGDEVVSVSPAIARLEPGVNVAGEPRDEVSFDRVSLPLSAVRSAQGQVDAERLRRRGALARAVGIAGALDGVTELTLSHIRAREQFGRRLVDFQAVQQGIAYLVGEVAATHAAVDAALANENLANVAAAKVQASTAATSVARIAHQLHGAIGMTHESVLHLFTCRLWAWRDEYGSESLWAGLLGREAAGVEGLWEFLADGALA